MKKICVLVLICGMLGLGVGCSNLNNTQKGALAGGGIGALAGTGVAAIAHTSLGWGAAIGAVSGAVIGGVVGNSMDNSRGR